MKLKDKILDSINDRKEQLDLEYENEKSIKAEIEVLQWVLSELEQEEKEKGVKVDFKQKINSVLYRYGISDLTKLSIRSDIELIMKQEFYDIQDELEEYRLKEAQEEKEKWISVEEREPGYGCYIWIWYNNMPIKVRRAKNFDKPDWLVSDGVACLLSDIKYWMPYSLPQPPKQ